MCPEKGISKTMSKANIDEINRNIYDIKNKD